MGVPGSAIPFTAGWRAKETCPECDGDGESSTTRGGIDCYPANCEYCGGRGLVSKRRLVEFKREDPEVAIIFEQAMKVRGEWRLQNMVPIND